MKQYISQRKKTFSHDFGVTFVPYSSQSIAHSHSLEINPQRLNQRIWFCAGKRKINHYFVEMLLLSAVEMVPCKFWDQSFLLCCFTFDKQQGKHITRFQALTSLSERNVARLGRLHESVRDWNRAGQKVDLLFQVPNLNTKLFKNSTSSAGPVKTKGGTVQVFVRAKIFPDPCKWGRSLQISLKSSKLLSVLLCRFGHKITTLTGIRIHK